jgi:uncharacterized protein (DUF697 family)/tellurite resistance protein
MERAEQSALMTLALMAAFADGSKGEDERAAVRRVAESLASDLNTAVLVQDVLLGRVSMSATVAALPSPELRQLAYELAVGVCDADGLRNERETAFLRELGEALGLGQANIDRPTGIADALAVTPLDGGPSGEAPGALRAGPGVPESTGRGGAAPPADAGAGLDAMILNYSILNGALELLPQSAASLAIIPLQMKMVYRIGKAHGFELDRGHIKDLLATMGVGMTGQYLEDIGRKLIGGLFGKTAGRMAGGLARGATGVAFSFATTYALGQVARRYYAGGRTMNAQTLKDAYASMVGQARDLQGQYLPQIEEQARSVDLGRIVQMVRGA